MASTKPLLSSEDVEAPPSKMESEEILPPTKSELALELKVGKMSRTELMMFFANPNNWPITILMICCMVVLLDTLYEEIHAGVAEHKMFFKVQHYFLIPLAVSFGGLVFATYYTFIAKQLQELVDRFRALNKRLEKNIDRLEQTSAELRDELEQFKELKEQLQAFAKEQNTDFKEVFSKISSLFTKMSDTARLQQVQILQQLAQGLEFMDDEEGISRTEWRRFVSRVPKEFKPKIEEIDFDSITAAGKDHVEFETVNDLIKKVISKESFASFTASFDQP